MLIVQFRVHAVPGVEPDVKEVIAMACEALGKTFVSEIENNDSGMHITVQIEAPDGSVQMFKKMLQPHLNLFPDTQLTMLQEIIPEQIKM